MTRHSLVEFNPGKVKPGRFFGDLIKVMGMLKRSQLAKQNKMKIDKTGKVTLQDGTVEKFCVLRMQAGERGRWEGLFKDKNGNPHPTRRFQVREYLVIFTLCDEEGRREYEIDPDKIEEYVKELSGLDGVVVETIANHAMEYNEVSQEDMDDLAGNLPPTKDTNSDTILPK